MQTLPKSECPSKFVYSSFLMLLKKSYLFSNFRSGFCKEQNNHKKKQKMTVIPPFGESQGQ